jgi:hypothetical protein
MPLRKYCFVINAIIVGEFPKFALNAPSEELNFLVWEQKEWLEK